MSAFKYVGRDKFGQMIEGKLEGHSSLSVAMKLASIEVTPITIAPYSTRKSVEEWIGNHFGLNAPKMDELIIFSQQMYTLIKAGVSVVQALGVVRETSKNATLRHVMTDIVISLESGFTLSKAMEKHKFIFSPLIVSMIRVGENIGQLENSFFQIRSYLENEFETKKRIKSAFRYPIFVIMALIIGAGIVNLMVIPSFRDFFNAFDSTLPLPTRILIASSDIVLRYGWLILSGMIFAISGMVLYIRTKEGNRWWSYVKLNLPIVGGFIRRTLYARFCRTFAMSVRANVPFLESLQLVSGTVDNAYLAEKIINISHRIERGETLYAAAKESRIFSPLVLQMLAVGEETGKLDDLLVEVAIFYEKEVDYDLKKLSDLIEPLLISIVAVMVLLLALGVFLPMWDISTVALKKMEGI